MRFESASFLIWAWLLVPALLLFLFRRRPRRVRVTTLAFFKSLAAAYQESPWLRRLKRALAVLLAVATVLGGVGALAHLVVSPDAGDVKSVVIVFDGSASMAAEDGDGLTRLAAGKRRLDERLAGLQAGVGVLVMRYDRRPEILLPNTTDRRAVERALDAIEVRPVEGDAETALALAARLARLQAPAAIWHVTDAPTADALDEARTAAEEDDPEDEGSPEPATDESTDVAARLGLPDDVRLDTIDVGLPRPVNAGISAFQLRPLPLEHGRFDAFVEIHAQGPQPVDVTLEVKIDGRLVSLREMTVVPGGSERLVIPVEASQGSVLSLQIGCEGDGFGTDDILHARIPELVATRLLWVRPSPDPFTQLAIMALSKTGELEAFEAEPSVWPPDEPFDIVLFDGWLPDTWPEDVPVIVMHPPRSVGPIRAAPIENEAGLPVDPLRAINEHHPVLYGVASDRVALTQTAVLEAAGSLVPLWVGEAGPLMVAGEVRGQRIVVMAFSPEKSERLPFMASYPLLLGNAVLWLTKGDEAERAGNSLRTGHVIDVEGDAIVWSAPGRAASARVPVRGGVAELDRVGLWRVGELEGSAALLSRRETLLGDQRDDVSQAEGASAGGGLFRGDLRPFLLWCVFLFLLLEAWLFHRHAVY